MFIPRELYALQCDTYRCNAVLRDHLGDEVLLWGADPSGEETLMADSLGWLLTPSGKAYCDLHASEAVDRALAEIGREAMGAEPLPGLDEPA